MVLNEYGKIVERRWYDLAEHYANIELDAFVAMPNHMHGIIVLINFVGAGFKPAPTVKYHPLPEIIRVFKTFSSRRINELLKVHEIPVWQRNYYEHIVRNDAELSLVREYITNNPLQWRFDRENPQSIRDNPYDNQWSHFEEDIYGKIKK